MEGHADGELLLDSREIGRDHQNLVLLSAPAQVGQEALLPGDMVHPLEALRRVVQRVQLGAGAVEMVQILYQLRNPLMLRHLGKLPFHRPGLVPLIKFGQILPHEQQLLARMRHHISIGKAEVGKFLLPVPGHLPDQGGLAVHHLIVGEHQHELLAVGIDHAEGQLPVMVGPEIGVVSDVAQIVVHEAHVPLQVEAQAVLFQCPCDPGEGGALLGDAQHARIALLHDGVQVLDHLDGLQVLLAAVHVGHPFAVLFPIVQIEHAGHRVHADAVRVELLHPEQGVGDQVIGDLGPAVVVDQCAPVGMAALSGIHMLVEAGAVKVGKPVGVPGEMGRNPVQDHADARLVELIHEIHEILRRAVPGRRRVVTDHLVSPGAVQGMLHDGHQLYVGVAHLLDIRNQLRRDLPVIGVAAGGLPLLGRGHKGAQIHLIHAHRRVPGLESGPALQEFPVLPDKAVQIRHHRSRLRPKLGGIAVGVCLQIGHPALYLELEFIIVPRLCVRQENLEDA